MVRSDSEAFSALYLAIGPAFITRAVAEFYQRAFFDPIIGHFFFGKDHQHLIAQQTAFATAMLGGPKGYRGKSLEAVHRPLAIRAPHFGRRQVLMAEVLRDLGLDEGLARQWLTMENNLSSLIVKGTC